MFDLFKLFFRFEWQIKELVALNKCSARDRQWKYWIEIVVAIVAIYESWLPSQGFK